MLIPGTLPELIFNEFYTYLPLYRTSSLSLRDSQLISFKGR